ncbi:hypothetical protein [Peterkaempfera bronchialis]|uniref:hypothetical protein n=1 Tax=Peterkaempfera bronchialis TaxID=2126346 RepID=UPI003C2B1EEC
MNSTDQHTATRPAPPRPRRSATAIAALLLAAGLATGATACSGTDAPPAAPPAVAPSGVESVSPQLAAARAEASATLKSVQGRGNAVKDVELSGVPEDTAHGHPAATVKITNHTDRSASYAVQVDFEDSSGKTVETTVTALRNLGPGQTATLLTFGEKPATAPTTPKIAKAQRD